MTDQVEVKLGAQTDELRNQIAASAASVQSSLKEMVDALKGLSTQSKSTEEQAKQSAKGIGTQFGEMKNKVKDHVDGTVAVIEKFKTVAIGLGAVLAGGLLWREAISGLLHLQNEVETLQNVFGMMSGEAVNTALALKILGKSSAEYAALGLKMARQLRDNEAEMNALGVQTRETTGGAMLPFNTVMHNAFEAMQEYAPGIDQAQFAMKFFGRSVQEVYEFVDKFAAAQTRAAELQKELNIEMGAEKQAQIEKYKLELGATSVVFGNIADTIGEAVLPNVMSLARWFNETGPAIGNFVVNAVKVLITAFDELIMIIKSVAAYASGTWEGLKAGAIATGQIVMAALEGQWTSIPGIVAKANAEQERIVKDTNARILKNYEDTTNRIGKLWTDVPAGGGAGTAPNFKSGTKRMPPSAGTGGAAAESRTGQWQAELAAQRDAFEQMKLEQGSFQQWSLDQTVQYWAGVRARTDLSAKERIEVDRNYYAALRQLRQEAFGDEIAALEKQKDEYRYASQERINIATTEYNMIAQRYGEESKQAAAAYSKVVDERRKLSDQIKAIDEIRQKQTEAYLAHDLKMEELANTQDVALRRISTEQKLALDADLENKRFDIALAGAKARQALETDPKKIAALDLEIEAIELAHQEKLTSIQNAAVLERNAFVIGAQDAVQSASASLFNDLISHTKSLKDTLKDFANSLTQTLNKLAADQLAKQFFGAGSAGNSIVGSIFGGAGGGGGGGFDFMSILQGLMPSAATGMSYVPQDGPVFVHAGEAIVPARYNTGKSRGGPGAIHNNVNISFALSGNIDGRTQDQIAARTARAVQRATNRIV